MVRTEPPCTKAPVAARAHSTRHHKSNFIADGFFMSNSSTGAAASAASTDVVELDLDTVEIKAHLVLFKRRSRVCGMCYHATTDLAG